MPRYMLDAETCSYIMKRSHDLVLKRLQRVPVNEVSLSVITKSELLFGVELSPRRQLDELALKAFLGYIEVLDFTDEASFHYAKIRADLKGAVRWLAPTTYS
jgi:tRNA(fMet)-specific endonuclease VapC